MLRYLEDRINAMIKIWGLDGAMSAEAAETRAMETSPMETSPKETSMERAELLTTITDLAVEILGVEPGSMTEEARFKEDLDADSLDLVEFVMALEERFDITVPEEEVEGVTTVGQAIDLVTEKLSARA